MPFNNPPSNNPSIISTTKFFVPSLLGIPPSASNNGPRPNLATRIYKKLKQKIKRFAKFTTWFTGLQPNSPSLIKFQTRIRKTLKKASFKLQKLARFTNWHTGLQPSIQVVKFQTRVRKYLKKTNFQLRKLAKFTSWHFSPSNNINTTRFRTRIRSFNKKASLQLRKLVRFTVFHTGVQPNPVIKFSARVRRTAKKASYQLRKLARFTIWHVLSTPTPIENLRLHTRRRSINNTGRRLGKRAHFFVVYNTGLQTSVIVIRVRTRVTRRAKPSYQYRKIAHMAIWHFTPVIPPATNREWVSPKISHSRGDQ